jgi:hypothetical protein
MLNKNQIRFYQIAGITIKIESDLPISDNTFHPKFRVFEVNHPGADTITIRYHFKLPDKQLINSGKLLYERSPWAIRRDKGKWIYANFAEPGSNLRRQKVAFFNVDHSQGDIYSNGPDVFYEGLLDSLTLFPTDQVVLGRALADRQAFLIHSSGAVLRGKGFLFLGHSEAGKSTIINLLGTRAEILCDDRMIIRQWPDSFRIHGTWSHGDIPIVSGSSAPLLGLFFLKKSTRNCLNPIEDRKEVLSRLLACLIKPLCTTDWWDKVLALMEVLVRETRFYELEFDKSGRIAEILEQLAQVA